MEKRFKNRIVSIILSCLFVVLIVIVPFLCIFLTGICLPAQYDETYYGELACMFSNLKNTKGKKIVVLGNSNVAFGVDSALAERLLNEAGEEYSVCNFGLYGAIGTKAMCELALDYINSEDIVIFTPELYEQSLSTYFSAEELWYALDSDLSMYKHFSSQSKQALAGNYFKYTSKKLALYKSGKKAEPSGIYAKSSFDEHCDLKNYPRPNNVMTNGADMNNPITLDGGLFSEDFVSYINDYATSLAKKGANMYYSFAPMNAYSMSSEQIENVDTFYDTVNELFSFDVISKPQDYVLEGEWFYDSNFHLNESGMTLRTIRLVNDMKNQLGNTTKTNCALPEKPVIPNPDIQGEGDNTDSAMFEYRLDGSYYTVVGLTDEGKNKAELTIPYQVDGIYIKAFLPAVFFDNKIIKTVTIQNNIHTISNGSFFGCDSLERIILKHTEPAEIAVGYELLGGAPQDCKIYVPQSALSQFANNYFWGKYAKQLQGY